MNYFYVFICAVPYIFLFGMLLMDREKNLATWQCYLIVTLLIIPAFIAGWFSHVIYLGG